MRVFNYTLMAVLLTAGCVFGCPPAASFQAGYSATTVQSFALPNATAGACPCQANALSLQQGYAAPLTGSVGGCSSAAPLLQQGYGLNAGYGTLGAGVGGCGSLNAGYGLGAGYGTGGYFPSNALPRGYGGGLHVLAQRQLLELEVARRRELQLRYGVPSHPFGVGVIPPIPPHVWHGPIVGAARLAELAALAARRVAFFPFHR